MSIFAEIKQFFTEKTNIKQLKTDIKSLFISSGKNI
jgi:hypothetical protein